ncbi:hypothetical protein NP493_1428g00000 [Ridgeia piscesae]|uniref:Uncharacterized protein n=1 Tax=Ridgeia piscesae TaxID=27915 RepID=A0AAD9K578_RIDPI|nr:hypothetical protein NP493_1428g00000 [Ridgeia piscesae]
MFQPGGLAVGWNKVTWKRSNLAEPKAGKRDRSPASHKLSVTINDLPSDKEPESVSSVSVNRNQREVCQSIGTNNVNEYLRISAASSTDKQQTQRIKTAFEKRNQKSTQVIDQLQRKLETYKKRIHETQLLTTVANTRHRPSKNVFRDVGQGLKDVGANIKEGITGFSGSLVSKPKDLVSLVKNKFSSADNISALKDDVSSMEEPDKLSHPGSNTLPPGFKYGSDDEASSLTSGSLGPSGTRSTPPHAGISTTSQLADPCPIDLGPTMAELHEVRETQTDIQQDIQSVKTQMQLEFNFMKQSLDEERYRSERLEEQINDLTELHQHEVTNLRQVSVSLCQHEVTNLRQHEVTNLRQVSVSLCLHEVTNLRQEMSGIEEKMEYQLDERTRDLQEALENCQTRVSDLCLY